jgi:phage shock protein PspC (stress-responsive transcriptional regulator)
MENRLYRSRTKKVVAGIGGGLGDYLDIDPVIIRIIIVLITIFNGVGLLIYIIMWIIIPEEPHTAASEKPGPNVNYSEESKDEKTVSDAAPQENPPKSSGGRIIFGVLLILVGLVFLSEKFFPFLDFEFVFAVGLIALGIAILVNFSNKSEKRL